VHATIGKSGILVKSDTLMIPKRWKLNKIVESDISLDAL
jgi:hypothetical protein